MKKFVKACSIFVFICVLFTIFNITAFAYNIGENAVVSSEICNDIANEIKPFEKYKKLIEMDDVNFNNLCVGKGIYVYVYIYNGFERIATVYPIFEGNMIVSSVYVDSDENYQVMTQLGKALQASDINGGCAIVYDANGCYIYDGSDFTLILNSDVNISERKQISSVSNSEKEQLQIENCFLKRQLNINEKSFLTHGAFDYTYCSVNYVTQNPYDSICWAACIAMINNCVNGTSYTAVNVAQRYFNSTTNFNRGLTAVPVKNFMNSEYGLNYTYKRSVPSNSAILSNIKNSKPIFAIFSSSTNDHACTLYGINLIDGIVVVMNPLQGSMACYVRNGAYRYVSSQNALVYTFSEAICRSW